MPGIIQIFTLPDLNHFQCYEVRISIPHTCKSLMGLMFWIKLTR
jgi:hypothetical protein